MKPAHCERAMKTATDFLVKNKISNLYVYVVDNKVDNVWESSISVFYTRYVLKKYDNIKFCFISVLENCYNGVKLIFKSIFIDGIKGLFELLTSTIFC